MKNDVNRAIFPDVPLTGITHPKVIDGMKTRPPHVKNMKWMDV
jgi:hypothetical protein